VLAVITKKPLQKVLRIVLISPPQAASQAASPPSKPTDAPSVSHLLDVARCSFLARSVFFLNSAVIGIQDVARGETRPYM
jgi:hypothetical protein